MFVYVTLFPNPDPKQLTIQKYNVNKETREEKSFQEKACLSQQIVLLVPGYNPQAGGWKEEKEAGNWEML